MKTTEMYDEHIIRKIVDDPPSKICQTCDAKGQTKECATIVKQVKPKVWSTTQLGSGCLVCGGRGIIGDRRTYPGPLTGATA